MDNLRHAISYIERILEIMRLKQNIARNSAPIVVLPKSHFHKMAKRNKLGGERNKLGGERNKTYRERNKPATERNIISI